VQPLVQSVAVPPPYYGFSVEGELRATEVPAYDEDPQARTVVSAAAATAGVLDGSSSGSVLPARHQDIAELRAVEEGVYVIHYISPRDTLVGISLKYNVKVRRA
jgi:hypothetical protein